MEDIKPAVYLVELRRPEKPLYTLLSLCVKKQDLLGVDKTVQGVRTPDVKGVVAVGVVCGNEIVFALPYRDAGVGTVYCNGEGVVVLLDSAVNRIASGLVKINAGKLPVNRLFVL